MPRLNGNSSQGSKPTTAPSRTFNWMPHCWPQKQQWVLTSRSGGCVRSSPQPPGGVKARCGPKRSWVSGGLATCGLLQAQLGARQGLPLAGRAEVLPAPRRGRGIVEAELPEHLLQVVDVQARGEALAAARA